MLDARRSVVTTCGVFTAAIFSLCVIASSPPSAQVQTDGAATSPDDHGLVRYQRLQAFARTVRDN